MSRVAILIDGDNIPASHAARIAEVGRSEGRVDLHRAYGNATNGSGWNAVPGIRFVHAGTGKNAADLLLSIDAMELALRDGYEAFVIASSDGDFSHLAIRLRETGNLVVGCGVATAPSRFRTACSRFETLAPAETAAALPAPVSKAMSPVDRAICTIAQRDASKRKGGVTLSELGNRLKAEQGLGRDDLPARSLKAYLSGKPALYEIYPPDAPVCVRLAPDTQHG